ncbi:ADP-ribosylation factor 4 [Tubulinosema ratisbonensis]|uniref:ADP-ribosylation factor 4 n=1 Tax=Tubulinosema ratisbonensis TaxID=291195 RepID=A0A437ANI9_9MICR|nr:ADP-ribosylation factor 4 [Tubulinosema ratisbonensis]RVD92781.1 ADP-ribosylation factor 4 [Tubulinosema ratisbonensis]
MGAIIIKRLKKIFHTGKPQNILMLGLDAVGKTTILYLLQNNSTVQTVPTIGFNIEDVTIGDTTLKICDMGGQKKIRDLWRSYTDNTTGIVYVFDLNDNQRWGEAVSQLTEVTQTMNLPVLILLNKVDILIKHNINVDNAVNTVMEMCKKSIPNAKFKAFEVSALVNPEKPYENYLAFEKAFSWLNRAIEGKE